MDEDGEPLPLPSGLFPIEPSPHAAYQSIAEQQRRGYLKRCAHLSLLPLAVGHAKGIAFQVICERNSFEPTTGTSPYFMGRCPKDCRLYRVPWRGKLNRWYRNQHPMIWFERQPWQVKVTVILVPVLALAIVFHVVKDLVALGRIVYEIVHGK